MRASADGCHVLVHGPDDFEGAVRKFLKACRESGLLTELKRRQAYEPPSLARRKKAIRARARTARAARRLRENGPPADWKPNSTKELMR